MLIAGYSFAAVLTFTYSVHLISNPTLKQKKKAFASELRTM